MAQKRRKPGSVYFTSVARTGEDAVILTGNYYALEESPETRTALISLRQGAWRTLNISGIAHCVRLASQPGASSRQYVVLERNRGLYWVAPPREVRFERVHQERRGFLMDLRNIGGSWYAVGGHHQIYRLNGRRWTSLDSGIYEAGDAGEAKNLLSIHGSSPSDIYTVGLNGVIYHSDGRRFSRQDSPTNCGLQRVLCVSSNEVYLCGYANSLYRGNTDGWEALSEPDEEIIFWDMAYFQGKVYVCTKRALFVLERNRLRPVEIPVDGPLGFYRMDCDEDELWTCGNECVLRFDGRRWRQYVFPENE